MGGGEACGCPCPGYTQLSSQKQVPHTPPLLEPLPDTPSYSLMRTSPPRAHATVPPPATPPQLHLPLQGLGILSQRTVPPRGAHTDVAWAGLGRRPGAIPERPPCVSPTPSNPGTRLHLQIRLYIDRELFLQTRSSTWQGAKRFQGRWGWPNEARVSQNYQMHFSEDNYFWFGQSPASSQLTVSSRRRIQTWPIRDHLVSRKSAAAPSQVGGFTGKATSSRKTCGVSTSKAITPASSSSLVCDR